MLQSDLRRVARHRHLPCRQQTLHCLIEEDRSFDHHVGQRQTGESFADGADLEQGIRGGLLAANLHLAIDTGLSRAVWPHQADHHSNRPFAVNDGQRQGVNLRWLIVR